MLRGSFFILMSDSKYYNPYKLFVGAFIPNWLLERPEISANAKLVFARLCQYAGQNGEVYPAQGTLCKDIGVSKRTLQRAIEELVSFKLIEAKRTGLGQSNAYYFVAHPWLKSRNNGASIDDKSDVTLTTNLTHPVAPTLANKENHIRESMKRNKEASPEARSYIERFVLRIPATMIPKGSQAAAKWEKCYDDMILLDKRNPDEIEKVTWWALDDEFWKDNFMSPLKLRKKNKDGVCYFDVFKTQMLKPKRNGYHKPSVEALPEIGEDYVAQ
jgi:hypothetical protein